MRTIRIELVASIDFKYPYLEVFRNDENNPFLDVEISDDRQLVFKFYASDTEFETNLEDWEYIVNRAKVFLIEALENEGKFSDFFGN